VTGNQCSFFNAAVTVTVIALLLQQSLDRQWCNAFASVCHSERFGTLWTYCNLSSTLAWTLI